jgi:hypothetical protein
MHTAAAAAASHVTTPRGRRTIGRTGNLLIIIDLDFAKTVRDEVR